MMLGALLTILGALLVADAKPLTGCGGRAADIVFVVDESGSIWGPDFTDRQLPFVKGVVDAFDIGPDKTQVGMLTFSDATRLHFHLNAYKTAKQIRGAVDAVSQTRGGTKTYDAIKFMRDVSFTAKNGARDGIKRIGIVITDGESDDTARTLREARAAKDRGVVLFAIGVGRSIKTAELEGIASEPSSEFVFEVTNYKALASIRDKLAIRTCEVTTPVPPTTPPPQMIEGCNGHNPVDAVFALSDIAGPRDTGAALDFVKAVSTDAKISPERVQIGVTPRWCDAAEIKLSDNRDAASLGAALDARRPAALRPEVHLLHMRTKSFLKSGGGRAGTAKVGVLIVDAALKNPEKALDEADLAKGDMQLVVIGVGAAAKQPKVADVLKDMATSRDKHYFHAADYAGVLKLKENILRIFCSAARNGGSVGGGGGNVGMMSEFGGGDLEGL